MFQTEPGIDVVRALHPDITGRSIPKDPPVTGRRFIVEHPDSVAYLADQPPRTPAVADHPYHRTEFAWISWDDPAAAVVMATRLPWTVRNRLCAASDNLPRRFVLRMASVQLKLGGFPINLGGFENGPCEASDATVEQVTVQLKAGLGDDVSVGKDKA